MLLKLKQYDNISELKSVYFGLFPFLFILLNV